MRIESLKTLAGIVVCAVLLSGCFGGGASAVRYYLVDPVEFVAATDSDDRTLAIEIIDVHIPQYLQRFQIVTRSGGSQLKFSQNNQWGENLRKNLIRTMAGNLARLLSTIDIGTPLNRSASLPDYRLQVHIVQFERDNDGSVRLVARWQLSNAEEVELGMHAASLESDVSTASDNYDDIVSAMQELYGQLSQRIADSIIEEENKRNP